ncbi:MAG: DUF3341 domain-containing protein [Candidatus Acidiferrales bacterium]
MAKNTAVFGIYPDTTRVESAIVELRDAGYRNTDISILLPENVGSKDFGVAKTTKAPEGATTGAGSGAVIGGTLGWLAGIGAIAIPGIGPFIAAGPIVAALAGIGAGGVVGGLAGALVGFGIPEYEAKRYSGAGGKRRHPAFGSLRRCELDRQSQGHPERNRRRGHFFQFGSSR